MQYENGTFNTIQPSPFDEKTGMILTNANLVFLQNLRAAYAQDLVNLELDVTNPLPYAVSKASLQAQIALIGYLMDVHESATKAQEQNPQEQ